MRKILLFVAVMFAASVWNNVDARWDLKGQISADEIVPGKTIVFHYTRENSEKWFTANFKTGQAKTADAANQLCPEAVWVVKEGFEDIRTGAPTIYLQTYAADANGDNLYLAPGCTLSDEMGAANFQVLPFVEEIPWSTGYAWDEYQYNVVREDVLAERPDAKWIGNWWQAVGKNGTNEKTVGFSYSLGTDITDPEAVIWLNGYAKGCFASYMDCIMWNVYEIEYVKDFFGDLSALVEQYLNEFNPVGGTTPGFYTPEKVEAFTGVLEEAMLMVLLGEVDPTMYTDNEYKEEMEKLTEAREACENSMIPLTNGYYYIVSAHDDFMNQQDVEKAAYPNLETGNMWWDTFDPMNANMIFYIQKDGDEDYIYSIQNFGTDYYIGEQADWYNQRTPITPTYESPQYLQPRFEGMWWWGSKAQHATSICVCNGGSVGGVEKGACSTWGAWNDDLRGHWNVWYLRPVPEDVIEQLTPIKEQATRTKTLLALVEEATALNDKMYVYETDTENPIITIADTIDAENQITFTTIRKQGVDGADNYCFLIDGDPVTYMQGKGNIDVNMTAAKATSCVAYSYATRGGTDQQQGWGMNERPASVSVYASNDTTNGNWTYIRDIEMADAFTGIVNLGETYQYVRFAVNKNATGGDYFTLGEFQLYKSELSMTKSQYYSVTGMKEAVDAMNVASLKAQDIIVANTTTEQDIADMQAAIDGVRALYADVDALKALITECEIISGSLTIGEEVGELPEDKSFVKDDLDNALNNAKDVVENHSDDKAVFDKAVKDLQDAKAAVYANIKFVEDGKWYFISSMDQIRTEETYCSGNLLYAESASKSANMIWGLYDREAGDVTTKADPRSMWRFEKIEGTEYFSIQNMLNGIYLGTPEKKDKDAFSQNVKFSIEPVPYKIEFAGNKQFTLAPAVNNKNNYVLNASEAENKVINLYTPIENGSTSWTFVELTEDEDAVCISTFGHNLTDVFVVPFNCEDLDINEDQDAHWYRLKSLVGDAENGYTGMTLSETTSLEAGEAAVFVSGSLDEEEEVLQQDLIIPFPTEIVSEGMTAAQCNGIQGTIYGGSGVAGTAVSNGKKYIVLKENTGISALTGVINPYEYQGNKEDLSEDLSIEFDGVMTGVKGKKTNKSVKTGAIVGLDAVNYGTDAKALKPGVYMRDKAKFIVK